MVCIDDPHIGEYKTPRRFGFDKNTNYMTIKSFADYWCTIFTKDQTATSVGVIRKSNEFNMNFLSISTDKNGGLQIANVTDPSNPQDVMEKDVVIRMLCAPKAGPMKDKVDSSPNGRLIATLSGTDNSLATVNNPTICKMRISCQDSKGNYDQICKLLGYDSFNKIANNSQCTDDTRTAGYDELAILTLDSSGVGFRAVDGRVSPGDPIPFNNAFKILTSLTCNVKSPKQKNNNSQFMDREENGQGDENGGGRGQGARSGKPRTPRKPTRGRE